MHNMRVEIYLSFGAKRGLQPGRSTSGSSESLLQRGEGKVSVCVILVKGWVGPAVKHVFLH